MKNCEYVVYDVMPIYILFMYPNICDDEYSYPLCCCCCCCVLWCVYFWGIDTQDEELYFAGHLEGGDEDILP